METQSPPAAAAPSGGDSPLDLLRDAQSPRSLQNPPPKLPSSASASSSSARGRDRDDVDLSQLTQQDAADALFSDSEILAPMVRASTIPLRTLALSHGADLVYTEELVDRSIFPTERILNEELGTVDYRIPLSTYSPKVQRRMAADADNPDSKDGAVLLRIDPIVERNRLIYQVGTGESDLALQAATKVINDVSGMDVNMGCPKKFSVSGGMGSALLDDVKRACDIVSTLRRNLSNKPVSAKIRLLHPDDPRPTLDFARALIKAGACAITVHGRIVGDESHVDARWSTLSEVVGELKRTETVPIIANGDMYTRADIREMKRRTGCDGVMLARPALYNVSLFRKGGVGGDIDGGGSIVAEAKECDQKDVPLSQFQTANHSGQYGYNSPLLLPRTQVVQEYIAHCVRYRGHSKNAKYVVCEMMNARRAPTSRVPYMDMSFGGGQNIQSVCKCRSLDDLVRVWDVRYTIPMPGSAASQRSSAVRVGGRCRDGNDAIQNNGDGVDGEGAAPHNYDDRYFLDHDKFREERKDATVVAATAASSGPTYSDSKSSGDEKKMEDECEAIARSGGTGPATKRMKI